MDATAIQLERELAPGTPVTLVGSGLTLEEHARVAGTITYELACKFDSSPGTRTKGGRRWARLSAAPPSAARAAELAAILDRLLR